MRIASRRAPEVGEGRVAVGSARSSRVVLGVALALILVSGAQKAYRLTLPFDGWSTTTDFGSDEPLYYRQLLPGLSPLRSGDQLVAVEGVPFSQLEERAAAGASTLTSVYVAGHTVQYTVLRGGEKVELDVFLHRGTSLGAWALLRELLGSEGVKDLWGWLGLLVAAFTFWRRPNLLTTRLLFLQAVASTASAISWTITPLSAADALRPVTFYLAAYFSHLIHLTLELPLALHIILSFPRPSPILARRFTLPLLYGVPVAAMLSAPLAAPIDPFFLVALYSLLGIVAAVRLFFRTKGPVEAAQVRWFTVGFAVANVGLMLFGLQMLGLVPEGVVRAAEAVPTQLVFTICIAVAILRYRLFDIHVILNRALVYGGLTAGVVGVYALVVGGASHLLHLEAHFGLSLLATGLVAVAFNPLRNQLQRAVNHLLYGHRDEPYKVLSELSRKVGGALEPAKVLPAITETVAQALKLPYASVVLTHGGTPELVASHGQPHAEPVVLKLEHQGEAIGELRLEPRAGGSFSTAELKLLRTIAQQASIAAFAVKQNLDLRRSREALVTAREEERLRIRRDLHDGLGPELAALNLKLDAACNLLTHDPPRAAALLLELQQQTKDAVSGIRHLVYALRPPALDELGLAGALREEARKYDAALSLTLEVNALDGLSAAAEVACYRIVQEALQNVVRHAGAARCRAVVRAGEALEISVDDDGVGLPHPLRVGMGLHSMRERAEELGGTFGVETSAWGGVRLRASIPL